MKKHLLLSSALLFGMMAAQAQTKPKSNKNPSNTTRTDSTGRATGTTGTTTTTGTTDHSGMNMSGDAGAMTSTGRYEALGARMGSLHKKDMKFAFLAHSSNTLELELSRMALQQSQSPAVREFAQMMVDHHSMAGQQMKQLLTSKGASIPDSVIMPRYRSRIESLQGLSGAEFDRAYARIMVDSHEEDVDEFEDETTDARDADLRAFATKMMPTLQAHYTRAKELRKQVK